MMNGEADDSSSSSSDTYPTSTASTETSSDSSEQQDTYPAAPTASNSDSNPFEQAAAEAEASRAQEQQLAQKERAAYENSDASFEAAVDKMEAIFHSRGKDDPAKAEAYLQQGVKKNRMVTIELHRRK